MTRDERSHLNLRLHSLALCLVLGLSACADDAPNANPPQLYDLPSATKAIRAAAKAVVRIQHPAGLSGTGSFISDDGLMLTNNHVLGTEECAREGCLFTLTFDHQRGEPNADPIDVFGVPEHADPGLDMAVLQVYEDDSLRRRLSTPDFLDFASRDSKELIGTRVTAVGHPLGRLKKWSSGVVIDADGSWFESTVFSLPGSSGSPMLDDEGKIVGLLHRGSDGFDLLTRTSSNVSAIGTAAASLEAALDAPLPATLISLDDSLTAEQVLAHSDAFLAGSEPEAQVDGTKVRILTVLADACDEGLAREDYTSLEELMSGLTPCLAAMDFSECRSDLDDALDAAVSCPMDRDDWIARMQAVVQRQLDFNGSLDLSPISFGLESLSLNESEGSARARRAILAALDQADPVYDFAMAPYLAAFGITSYAGQSTLDLIENYKRFPYYERSAWDIALTALWLFSTGALEREQALRITKQLYRNDKIDLGARLRIEEILYNSDQL
jgi:V8-like Glu-specific endopeptidase